MSATVTPNHLQSESQPRWTPPALTDEVRLQIHNLMVKARTTEEMLIRMMRTGHGYFWIGGPGEEGFGVPLGMLLHKGHGPDYDYLHLHYRSSPTVLAMGSEPIDLLRQMRGTVTDPYSKGRNFVNHFAIKAWNVVPVTPTIETQYAVAPGTAWVQRRHGGIGLSVVTGGDAGSAEGDFYCGMNWSTRPGYELPVLFTIAHNDFGISTPSSQVQNTKLLNTRGDGFGIKNAVVDGNDPIATWHALVDAMDYVRHERKPFILQANVSRLNGHSSSSGAARSPDEDCIARYEATLIAQKLASKQSLEAVWTHWQNHLQDALAQVLQEPMPTREHVLQHVFYTGPAGN